jgi:hypothetical protein
MRIDGVDLRSLSSEHISATLLAISETLSHRRENPATTPMFDVTLQWSSEILAKVAEALSRRSGEGEVVIEIQENATSLTASSS